MFGFTGSARKPTLQDSGISSGESFFERGGTVADVADLLGEGSKRTVREHYRGGFLSARRDSKDLKDAFDDKPKPSSFTSQAGAASDIQEPRVDPLRGGFGNAIDRVGFLPAHSDLDNPRIVFDQLAHGLAPKPPQLSEFANSVVLFKGGAINGIEKGLYI